MKVSDYVAYKIDRFKTGYVFTCNDFELPVKKNDSVIKILNRLVKSGKLKKLSKGRFYKPLKSQFGDLMPVSYQVVKDLLKKNGEIIGYITGYSAFNYLGLTTQVPNTIQIGTSKEKKPITRGVYKIRFIKQVNNITKENIPLLQILDSIKFIKIIPDTTSDQACKQLISIIKELTPEQINKLKNLVLKYSPATKALTGAILELLYPDMNLDVIYKSLNAATRYKLRIKEETLPNKRNWNIK